MEESFYTGLIELSCPHRKAGLITFSSSITPRDWLQVSKEAVLDKGKWPRVLPAPSYPCSQQAAALTLIYMTDVMHKKHARACA